MRIEFHPQVQNDFNEAIAYYEKYAGNHVANLFETEVRAAIAMIAREPRRFPYFGTTRVFRRIRLDRFPYVIVFRELPDSVRVTVLKHEKRQVRYGMGRR